MKHVKQNPPMTWFLWTLFSEPPNCPNSFVLYYDAVIWHMLVLRFLPLFSVGLKGQLILSPFYPQVPHTKYTIRFYFLYSSLNRHSNTIVLIFRDNKCNCVGNHRRSKHSSSTNAVLYQIAVLPDNVTKISTEYDFNFWPHLVILIQSSYCKLKQFC